MATVIGPQAIINAQGPAAPLTASTNAPANPMWAHVMQQFDEWAAVQQIYTPDQVRQWRAQILSKASSLPAADGQRFAQDLNAKLQVMLGAEARDARKWLAETLAVASEAYAKQIKAGLPDPQTMSAAQIQARLDNFEGREANVKQYEAGLQKTRQMQVQVAEANERSQEAANAAAWQGGGNLYGSAYHPGGNQRTYGRYVSPARSMGYGGFLGYGGFYW